MVKTTERTGDEMRKLPLDDATLDVLRQVADPTADEVVARLRRDYPDVPDRDVIPQLFRDAHASPAGSASA